MTAEDPGRPWQDQADANAGTETPAAAAEPVRMVADYYAKADLARLVDDLTIQDIRLSRLRFPHDPAMAGFAAVYNAAVRVGLSISETMDTFLGRVRLYDLQPLLEADRGPKSPPSEGSPGSAASGE